MYLVQVVTDLVSFSIRSRYFHDRIVDRLGENFYYSFTGYCVYVKQCYISPLHVGSNEICVDILVIASAAFDTVAGRPHVSKLVPEMACVLGMDP